MVVQDPPQEPWLAALTAGAEQRLSVVAALGQTARAKLLLGQAGECLAALAKQRAAAGGDQAALVWALTTSALCRAVFGQLGRARADLTEVRQACRHPPRCWPSRSGGSRRSCVTGWPAAGRPRRPQPPSSMTARSAR